ncbi:MAG: site-specific integrase [Chloroflexi bacterium]|nr:site-specific integrase [Chloroflexota bacterium]
MPAARPCGRSAGRRCRVYESAFALFRAWCLKQQASALPADPRTVAFYLTDTATRYRATTLDLHLAAIAYAHRAAGLPIPTTHQAVREVRTGVRRTRGAATRGKAALMTEDLRRLVSLLDQSPVGLRDRALLLMGFAGAFRRSELVGLDVDDLEFTPGGIRVELRRSKTDQEAEGRPVGIPYGVVPETCPVRAVERWLAHVRGVLPGYERGPLFLRLDAAGRVRLGHLSDRGVARVVQRWAERAGLDPLRFAGHSLRAGLATSAAAGGVSERAIMNQTGHRSLTMVRRYIRDGELFRDDNAARGAGL